MSDDRPSDDRLRALYQSALEARAAGARTESCPSADALIDLVERRGAEPDRLRTLDHVMACPHCRADFELLRSVSVAAESGAQKKGRAAWESRRTWLLAASIVVVLGSGLVWQTMRLRVGPEAVLRGAAESIELVGPIGAVSHEAARTLVWRSAPGAFRYEAELVDAAGDVLFRMETADTTVTLPGTLPLEAGQSYLWWVRARLTDGTERSARPDSFRVPPQS